MDKKVRIHVIRNRGGVRGFKFWWDGDTVKFQYLNTKAKILEEFSHDTLVGGDLVLAILSKFTESILEQEWETLLMHTN
jgi:hypothetical protein